MSMRKKTDPGARAIEFFQSAPLEVAQQVLEIAKVTVAGRSPRQQVAQKATRRNTRTPVKPEPDVTAHQQ